jgi:hypothetical protein
MLLILMVLMVLALVGQMPSLQASNPGRAGRALSTVVTLRPVADTFISQQAPTVSFATLPQLRVSATNLLAISAEHTLIRFDLSSIPPGAIINQAWLRLEQLSATGVWTVDLQRITQDWEVNTTTWDNQPFSVPVYKGLPTPNLRSSVSISWEIKSLVESWLYPHQGLPHYGLLLKGSDANSRDRVFASGESANPPELIIDYSPPPTQLLILEDATPVKLDGLCSLDQEYAKAARYEFIDAFNSVSRVYLKHDADNIYLCVVSVAGKLPTRYFGVYLDTDWGRTRFPSADDYALQVEVVSNKNSSQRGADNPNTPYVATQLTDWQAVAQASPSSESAEYVIGRSLFTRACTSPFGLALYHHWVRDTGDDFGLPVGRVYNEPALWLPVTLDNPGCIRVCSETATPCSGVGNARVLNVVTGAAFAVDRDGYVQNRTAIQDGDLLWSAAPVQRAHQATLYHTTGGPQKVNTSAFRNTQDGVMALVVTKQKPLWVQDLAISAQWYVEGDPQRMAWLQRQVIHAGDLLYAFTDGQFTLGQVTVFQSYDGWQDADLKLHIHNSFQPRAVIGGIVPTYTADISPTIPISYGPGHIYMGSYWNRFGKPPGEVVKIDGQPVPTATMSLDWSLALAHELGHYLLFQYDTYTDVDGNASQELARQCTGTAMGDVYEPGNHGFIFDARQWTGKCSATEAYAKLGGRTEWETIHLWHPWTIVPTTVVAGPVAPAGLTAVHFVTPTTPPGLPATSQVFNLLYVDNEQASEQARVFLLRNGQRVFDQGKPAAGATQVELIDAQLGDRLCVYDVTGAPATNLAARHQFGCKVIVANDATLQMTKEPSWAPWVQLRQTGPQQLSISVTQEISTPVNAHLIARLYPEHGELLAELALEPLGGLYRGVFLLSQPIPPVYVQLWVNEQVASPRTPREVMVERGVGGGGAFGPAKQFSGVFVSSSDGQASYENDEPLTLLPGQSIAWQPLIGQPALPTASDLLGQAYELDAFPPELVADGKVSLQYEAPVDGVQAASANDTVGIYFWDGKRWGALETTTVTPVNASDQVKLASAPSQGIGIYAVFVQHEQRQLFMPLVQRGN